MTALGRRAMLGGALAAGLAAPVRAQTPPPATGGGLPAGLWQPRETIDLWPGGAPGMSAVPAIETVTERATDPQLTNRAVFGITRPRMAVFRPERPNGAAVLIMPGGGYRWVVIDKEGYEMGRWLADRGVTVFVLFYRLPAEGWAAGADVVLQDTQRAMRLIRARAARYGVDPGRIAAMGFSAGGHACATLAARFAHRIAAPVDAVDALPARPALAATIYPVVSMSVPHAHAGSRAQLIGSTPTPEAERAQSPHLNLPADPPPHFIVHAEDDTVVPVDNALLLRAALRARGAALETHLFAEGGHGFGLRKAVGKPIEFWPSLFLAFARTHGFAV